MRKKVIPNTMHVMFAGVIFIASFFAIESPRWLVKVGKHEQAAINLSKLRNLDVDHWYVQSELIDINDQLEREREATKGTTWLGPVRELFSSKSNLYRIQLSIMSQLLSQWSGASSITIYAAKYFAMMGTTGDKEKLFATAIFGVVKFISAMLCAFFLIDYIGRKRSLMIGITCQLLAMLYMAIFLIMDTGIGEKGYVPTGSVKSAATCAIVMIYISGFGWALGKHSLDFTTLQAVANNIAGWNSVQYLINSEIYPLRLRALGGSFAMTFHFVNRKSPINILLSRNPSNDPHRIRQLQGRPHHVHRHVHRRHHVLLRRDHRYWLGLGLLLPARAGQQESRVCGRRLQPAMAPNWSPRQGAHPGYGRCCRELWRGQGEDGYGRERCRGAAGEEGLMNHGALDGKSMIPNEIMNILK